MASNYRQTCSVDTDCQVIQEGSTCVACSLTGCPGGSPINVADLPKYMADIANTPGLHGSGDAGCAPCETGVSQDSSYGPYCCSGMCEVGFTCAQLAAQDDAGGWGDAGGDDALLGGSFGSDICTSNGDCNDGQCVFTIGAACDAPGRCFFYSTDPPEPGCDAVEALCACTGNLVDSLECSDTYAFVPTIGGAYRCNAVGGDASADATPDVVDGSVAETSLAADAADASPE
jgi:hypothetical protein